MNSTTVHQRKKWHHGVEVKATPKETFTDVLTEYSKVATMHGLLYIFETKYGRMSRLLWTIITLLLEVLAAILIIQSYVKWKDHPILTTMTTTALPVRNISFPAITICGMGTVEEVVYEATWRQGFEYAEKKLGRSLVSEVLSSNDLPELLKSVGLDMNEFLSDKYPGLAVNPEEAIPVMISKNPDSVLTSEVVWDNFNPCSDPLAQTGDNSNTNGTFEPCNGADYAYDPEEEACYKIWGNEDYANGYYWCEDMGEMVIEFTTAQQLQGLKNLIKSEDGPLSFLSGGSQFLVEDVAWQNDEEVWIASEYAYVKPHDDILYNDPCPAMSYDANLDKLLGTYIPCDAGLSVVCMSASNIDCTQEWNENSTVGTDQNSNNRSALVLDNLINPKLKGMLNKGVMQKRDWYKTLFNQIDLAKAYNSFFEVLWYSQLPCFDTAVVPPRAGGIFLESKKSLLKKCSWKSLTIPCGAIFKTFPTDRGMCCTFNMQAADKIFKESQYQKNILAMQSQDIEYSVEKQKKPPKSYSDNNEPIPQAGINKGLSLILDAHTDLISPASVEKDFKGFIAVVDAIDSFPLTEQKSIYLRPGFDNLVALAATDIKADDGIRNLDSVVRNCYFKDEHPLKLNKDYSQASCMLECQLEYAQNNMTQSGGSPCIPWFLPVMDETFTPMCDPWEAKKFSRLIRSVPDTACVHCLPDCEVTSYSASVTTLPFRRCSEKNLGVSSLCDISNGFTNLAEPAIFAADLIREYDEDEWYSELPEYVKVWKTNMREHNQDKNARLFPSTEATYDAYQDSTKWWAALLLQKWPAFLAMLGAKILGMLDLTLHTAIVSSTPGHQTGKTAGGSFVQWYLGTSTVQMIDCTDGALKTRRWK